jgi:3-hydroxymyristoyl/3-hydroxydecanoyl-(acyl carrier protein) dehydratase
MQFTISVDHPCLPGHFPGRPVVPGVVVLERVLEAIGQAGGPVSAPLRLPQVKFLQPLLPGQRAQIELEPELDGEAPRWRFRVLCGDVLLASGEVRMADGAAS